jgi:site-specific recombinase XerD
MINSFPIITYIYNRYKKASSSTKASVEMRITYNKKQKYISTGIYLYPNQWKKGMIINTPDALQLNQMLDKMLVDVRNIILDMIRENYIDIFSIKDRLKKTTEESLTFIDFCSQRSTIRKYGKSPDTQDRYDRFIKSFKLWGKIITFKDITDNNIILYDNHLKGKGMKTYSIWNNYHRFLNSFIMDAIDAGYFTRNPYKWVNIIRGKHTDSINKCLATEEFRKIRKVILPTKSLERVRDVFVFQTYTCLSYSDLKAFDSSKIKEIKGMRVYIGNRQKTHQSFVIPLIKPALEILYKYNQHLPIISNVNYNEYLKIVAQAAGIDKPVSSHWARHTGATLLLNEGIPMNIISKICGHSSTKITEQIYAKLFDETIIDALLNISF